MSRWAATDACRSREAHRHALAGRLVAAALAAASLGALQASGFAADAGMPGNGPVLTLDSRQTIVEGSSLQVSPPALQFDQNGTLHLAWFEKQGETRGVYAGKIAQGSQAPPDRVPVNSKGAEPDAFHQSPGLATGPQGTVYVTWAVPKGGGPFASDLLLARSSDRGASFLPPVVVNDDGNPINHTFEFVSVGPDGGVYLAWLDNRGKDKSGAGAMFACSRDGGKTVEKNLTMDGMACPCCRPMAAMAPDGSLWVAWRKTFDGNVRDIVLVRSTDRGATFSPPMLVQRDGWTFPACPHRGPSLGFDRHGRLYVGWYTEGTDEQPRLLLATSDDQGRSFSPPVSLHMSATSLPDQLRMAVHPDGIVVAVWEEVTGVRKRVVARVSTDRGRSFGPMQTLSEGARAETPAVAVHESGALAIAWTEHAWPHNRIVLQRGKLPPAPAAGQP